MQNKKVIQVIAIVLALVLVVSLAVTVLSSAASAAPTQSEIDALKEKSAELSEKKSGVKDRIYAAETEQSSVLEKKAALDQQITLTQEQIENTTMQITLYEELIEQKQLQVEQAQLREDEQLERYKERVRTMEENGSISYLAVIFDASSFADLLARIDFLLEVMNFDEQLYNEYISAKEATIQAKKDLESSKEALEEAKADLETQKVELEKNIDEANRYLAEIEADIDKYEQMCAEIEAAQAELDAEIAEKVAELQRIREEEERRRKAEEEARRKAEQSRNQPTSNNSNSGGSVAVGTGNFIWPAPASYAITSDFGTRTRDNGTTRFHSGIDIGAGSGTNVLASDGGTVIAAYYHWSYGNMVMIDHGNGYITLYAHMQILYVSEGQSVSQGNVIGLVGNTGDSNGAHLHFEVRTSTSQSSAIDPKQFFSGWWYCLV